jgi:hypothetical protein
MSPSSRTRRTRLASHTNRAVLAAAPVALALVTALGPATAAHATDYQDMPTWQLGDDCYQQGQFLYQDPDGSSLDIPSTQLSQGSTGVCVAYAQRLMTGDPISGWGPGDVDGQFGPHTRSAVVAFQNWRISEGLGLRCGPADGVVGPRTWTCLIDQG